MKKLGIVALVLLGACSNEPTAVEPDMNERFDASNSERDMLDAVLDMSLRDVVSLLDSEQMADVGAPGSGGPYPHWVLRDRNGDAVEVWASPAYHPSVYSEPPPDVLTLPAARPYTCFGVSARGDEPWNGTYDLATGTMGPCVNELPAVSYHLDASCTGPPLIPGSIGGPGFLKVDGVVHYSARRLTSGDYYQRSDAGCAGPYPASASSNLYESDPVPDAYAEAFAAGAPYTIGVEY